MDKIVINDLEVYAKHGVFEAEKQLGQNFLISLVLDLDLEQAAIHDDLNKTVNYGELCDKVHDFVSTNCFDLVEKLAREIILLIFREYSLVERINILIKKPNAPISKHFDYAGVQLERSRGQLGYE